METLSFETLIDQRIALALNNFVPTAREFYNSKQAAEYLGCSVKHLESLRARGDGPKFIKKDRRVTSYIHSCIAA